MKRKLSCLFLTGLVLVFAWHSDTAYKIRYPAQYEYTMDYNPESSLFKFTEDQFKKPKSPAADDSKNIPTIVKTIDGNMPATTRLLLNHGADPNYIMPDTGVSLLFYAAANNKSNCIQPLLDFGADIHFTDSKGNNALDVAIENNHPQVIEILEQAGLKPNH